MEPDIKYLLYQIMTDTIAIVKLGGEVKVKELFLGRDDAEITRINTWLQDDKNVIKIILGDPRDPTDLPCLAIIRTTEGESPMAIGDVLEQEDEDNDTFDETLYGTDFINEYSIEVWTTNTDTREILYRIAKYGLFINRKYLAEKGLSEQRVSGNDEQGVLSENIPNFVYRSRLILSCRTSLQITEKYAQIPQIKANINMQ